MRKYRIISTEEFRASPIFHNKTTKKGILTPATTTSKQYFNAVNNRRNIFSLKAH